MSTRHSRGPQNGPTSANCLKRKLETSFLQHESKIEDSLQFFPDKCNESILIINMIVNNNVLETINQSIYRAFRIPSSWATWACIINISILNIPNMNMFLNWSFLIDLSAAESECLDLLSVEVYVQEHCHNALFILVSLGTCCFFLEHNVVLRNE